MKTAMSKFLLTFVAAVGVVVGCLYGQYGTGIDADYQTEHERAEYYKARYLKYMVMWEDTFPDPPGWQK